jgi:hypothetical protein
MHRPALRRQHLLSGKARARVFRGDAGAGAIAAPIMALDGDAVLAYNVSSFAASC